MHVLPRRLRAAFTAAAGLALVAGLVAGSGTPATAAAAPALKTTTLASKHHATTFGTADPTFDGVYRHALAVLGLHAAGRDVPRPAYRWLTRQQCGTGAFEAFRTPPKGRCSRYDAETFTGGFDTNATAVAAQALLTSPTPWVRARGRDAAAWLQRKQQRDGGWAYTPGAGFGSDPNSTALALMALDAAGLEPRRDATAYLAGLQVGRTLPAVVEGDAGGIATSFSGGAPNVLATVQVVPGVLGANLVEPPVPSSWARAPRSHDSAPPATAAGVGGWAASWVAAQVDAGHVQGNDLAWALLGLAADGTGRDVAARAYPTLRDAAFAATGDPAALGQAALVAKVLDRPKNLRRLGRMIEATTADAARPTLRRPKGVVTPKQARTLTGRTRPGAAPVDRVCVTVAQRRGGDWYSFHGSGEWTKRKSRKASLRRSIVRCVEPTGTTWKAKVGKVRPGRMVVRWWAESDTDAGRSLSRQRPVKVQRAGARR